MYLTLNSFPGFFYKTKSQNISDTVFCLNKTFSVLNQCTGFYYNLEI